MPRLSLTQKIVAALGAAAVGTAAAGEVRPNVIVESSRDGSDAATTEVQFDDTMPAAQWSMSEVTERVANLHVSSGGAGSYGDLFTLRGLSNTPYFSDPAVTVYLDDIPLGGGFSYPNGLFGFFDAAVRRGPQGTAFGRAGQGGVMVLSSGDLSAHRGPAVSANASFGNFDSRSASLTARADGAEAFTGSLAASFAERDGYIRNRQLGADVDAQEAYTLATRGRWQANEAAAFTVQVLANRQRNGAQPLVPLGSYFSVEREKEGRTDIDFFGAALKGEFATSLGRITSVTSHTQWDLDPYQNHVVLPPALDATVLQSQRAWNEELRLTSAADESPWLLGAWFSSTDTDGKVDRALTGLFPIEGSSFELQSRTVALFGEWHVAPAADWLLTAGLRAERTRREFDRDETVPMSQRFSADASFDAVLPKLALRYSLSPATNVTATLARSSKPGGWSAYTGNEELAGFDQERSNSLELALDSQVVPERLSVAARVFYYQIRDYQIERSFNFSDYLVVNAPRASSLGAELEGEWRPTREFTLSGSVGVTRAKLREFTDPFTGVSYDGNRAPYAPGYDANITAVYTSPIGWFAASEVSTIGRTYYDESESSSFAQGSRTEFAARAGYQAARWRVTLYGENLGNDRYYTMVVPGIAHGIPGAPRTWGVELATQLN